MFSDVLKNSLSSSRSSYVPRHGNGYYKGPGSSSYSKGPSPPSAPRVPDLHLSKKCGFSLPHDPSLTMEKYLCAIGELVGPQNMVFAGKNNDMVKMYLINEEKVETLLDLHPQVNIDGKLFTLRKLVNHGHRIFLCNVEPSIPDNMLANELSKYAKVVSPIQFVNLGCRMKEFSHLMGLRRCVFVDEVENLPASMNIFFDNVNYKVFVVIDKVRCFRCNIEGHISRNCTTEIPSAQERLDVIKSGDTSLNKESIEFLTPSFSSRTQVTSIPPLDNATFPGVSNFPFPPPSLLSIPPPPPLSSPPPSPASERPTTPSDTTITTTAIIEQLPPPTPPPLSQVTPPTDTTRTSETETEVTYETQVTQNSSVNEAMIVDESSQSTKLVTNDIHTKKRQSSSSPSRETGFDNNKKINRTQNTDLDCLFPLISGYDTSLDPRELIFLIEDLRFSKNKMEIISEKYSMNPQVVVSVIGKLFGEKNLEKKLKNRLKNLFKTLSGQLFNSEATSQDEVSKLSDTDMSDSL